MKLEPRKATDRGGWLCMPLVINGPEGKPGWKKVRCPECGTLCWQRPEDAGVVKASHLDGAVCTAGGEYHKWLSYPGLCENRRSESSKGGRRT